MNKPFEVVSDLAALHAIPENYRYEGMEVIVANTYTNGVKQKFTLSSGITNAAWVEGNVGGTPVSGGGGWSGDWDMTATTIDGPITFVGDSIAGYPAPSVIGGNEYTITQTGNGAVYGAASAIAGSIVGVEGAKWIALLPDVTAKGTGTLTTFFGFGPSIDDLNEVTPTGVYFVQNASGLSVNGSVMDPLAVSGTPIIIGVDEVNGLIHLVTQNISISGPAPVVAGWKPIVNAVLMVADGSSSSVDIRMSTTVGDTGGLTVPVGLTPFTSQVTVAPVGAEEGFSYRITGAGSFNGEVAAVGDVAQFVDGVASIVVTKKDAVIPSDLDAINPFNLSNGLAGFLMKGRLLGPIGSAPASWAAKAVATSDLSGVVDFDGCIVDNGTGDWATYPDGSIAYWYNGAWYNYQPSDGEVFGIGEVNPTDYTGTYGAFLPVVRDTSNQMTIPKGLSVDHAALAADLAPLGYSLAQVDVKKTLTSDVSASAATGNLVIDLSAGEYFSGTLTANVISMAFSNLPGAGSAFSFAMLLSQDPFVLFTLAIPATWKSADGAAAPVIPVGKRAMITGTSFDNGASVEYTFSVRAA